LFDLIQIDVRGWCYAGLVLLGMGQLLLIFYTWAPLKPNTHMSSKINLRKFQTRLFSSTLNLLRPTLSHTFTPNYPVRILGVIFDQNLSFSDHIFLALASCVSATFAESAI